MPFDEITIGTQICCENCKNNPTSKKGQQQSSCGDSEQQEQGHDSRTQLKVGIPVFFWRCAVTRELFDLLIELQLSSTAGGLAKNIRREQCISVSFNNTFRVAGKASVTNRDKQKVKVLKGGIISLMNENGEIIGWDQCFCHGQSNAEITELLDGLKTQCDKLDVPPPEIFVADNCCHVQSAVTIIFPHATMKLDVWHFIMRQAHVLVPSLS
ncbi:hypothetical protein EDB19DRAFT_1892663 [Suillus lakei]|nr:hypothetical protein EDB19DRAFT_1892663 [Suillus lakei]